MRRHRGLTLAIALVLVTGLIKARHASYLGGLRNYTELVSGRLRIPEFPRLTQSQVADLGAAHYDKETIRSSYMYLEPVKPRGRIRIGLFGDSAIFGEEAAHGRDMGSLLGDMFRERGHPEIEVVNFAFPGFGMHQSALMWEHIGKTYGLDLAVFYPFTIHYPWDTSFQNFPEQGLPLHARFVTADGGLRLISFEAKDLRAAALDYFGLLPSWKFLRYDRQPPFPIRLLLPKNRAFKSNPFYHSTSDMRTEALDTYRLLFRKIASECPRLLVVCDQPEICREAAAGSENSRFRESRVQGKVEEGSSIYVAPQYHWSALGNELRAEELYLFITGERSSSFRTLSLGKALPDARVPPGAPTRLDAFKEVRITAGGLVAGGFFSSVPGAPRLWYEAASDFRADGVAALLMTGTPSDPIFLKSPVALKDGDLVFAEFKWNGNRIEVPVGEVRSKIPYFGRLEGSCGTSPAIQGQRLCPDPDFGRMMFGEDPPPEDLRITLGSGRWPILHGTSLENTETSKFIRLASATKNTFRIRAKEGSFTLRDLGGRAPTELELLLLPDGPPLSVPFLRLSATPAAPLYGRSEEAFVPFKAPNPRRAGSLRAR